MVAPEESERRQLTVEGVFGFVASGFDEGAG